MEIYLQHFCTAENEYLPKVDGPVCLCRHQDVKNCNECHSRNTNKLSIVRRNKKNHFSKLRSKNILGQFEAKIFLFCSILLSFRSQNIKTKLNPVSRCFQVREYICEEVSRGVLHENKNIFWAFEKILSVHETHNSLNNRFLQIRCKIFCVQKSQMPTERITGFCILKNFKICGKIEIKHCIFVCSNQHGKMKG